MIRRVKTLSDLVGIDKQLDAIKAFLYDFQEKTPGHKKACLLHGHQGTGKSTTVECLANDLGFPLIEVNGSEVRTKGALIETLTKYLDINPRLNGTPVKHCIIFIDEVDGIEGMKIENKSAVEALHSLIKKTRHPIFLTANDDYPLRAIKDSIIKVQFYRHKPATIDQILRKYTSDEQKIYEIIQYCDGDIRAALNMLDSLSQKVFTKTEIFAAVDSILSGKPIDGTVDIPNQELLDWLDENAQYRLLGISHLLVYQNLCNASRLMRVSSKHCRNMLIKNCTLVSHFHVNEHIKVMPPAYRQKTYDHKDYRKTIESLRKKLPFHTGRQFESDVLPILRQLAKNQEWLKSLYFQHNLTEAEVTVLLGVTKSDIAVTSFMEQVKLTNTTQQPQPQAAQPTTFKMTLGNFSSA